MALLVERKCVLIFIVLFHPVWLISGQEYKRFHPESHSHKYKSEEHPAFKYSREANELHEPDESADAHNYEHIGNKRRPIDGRKVNALFDETRSHSKFKKTHETMRSNYELWFYGIGSTLLISMAPFVLLWFIPIDNTAEYEPLLKIFLSFASGGLLGDAFLHLIPHAILASEELSRRHGHVEIHSHDLNVGLWVVAGIAVFFIVEKFVRLVKGSSHSHHHRDMSSRRETVQERDTHAAGDSPRRRPRIPIRVPDIKASAYLNLAADFIHNFTDGLAIGASYLAGKEVGFITSLTVFFHEVPHELGDFAILIQSGYTKKTAMFLQLFTSVGAVCGASCGLLAEGFGNATTTWILPFTAGGFLYLAMVSVIPELMQDTDMKQSVGEIIGLVLGFGFMAGIAWYE